MTKKIILFFFIMTSGGMMMASKKIMPILHCLISSFYTSQQKKVLVREFLSRGGLVNYPYAVLGRSILFWALSNEYTSIVNLLLDAGGDVSLTVPNCSMTLLSFGLLTYGRSFHKGYVYYFIKKLLNAKNSAVALKDPRLMSRMIGAKMPLALIKLLFSLGAYCDGDLKTQNVLYTAFKENRSRVFEFFLSRGISIDNFFHGVHNQKKDMTSLVARKTWQSMNAFITLSAFYGGPLEKIKDLRNLWTADDSLPFFSNPIIKSIINNDDEMCLRLMNHFRSYSPTAALYYAVGQGSYSVIRLLLSLGANPLAQSPCYLTSISALRLLSLLLNNKHLKRRTDYERIGHILAEELTRMWGLIPIIPQRNRLSESPLNQLPPELIEHIIFYYLFS